MKLGLLRQTPATAAQFSPLTLSPFAWYDASDEATITVNGSDEVEQWNDKSGNARHMTPPSTDKPLSKLSQYDVNGLNTVHFTHQRLQSAAFTLIPQPVTVVQVYYTETIDGGQRNSFDGTNATNRVSVYEWLSTWRCFAGSALDSGVATAIAAAVITTVFKSTTTKIRVDGVETIGNAGTKGIDQLQIGRRYDVAAGCIGRMCEVLFFDKELASQDILDLEAHLTAKWKP